MYIKVLMCRSTHPTLFGNQPLIFIHIFLLNFVTRETEILFSRTFEAILLLTHDTLVAGAWTEREKMYHGGSFFKLAHDNV